MGRIIVITGVSRGLAGGWRKSSRALVTRSRVADVLRKNSRNFLESSASLINSPPLDVVREDEVAAWAKSVLASFGAPDLLLNNAAIINRNAPLWKVPAQEFSDVIDVNIKGVTNVLRHFVRPHRRTAGKAWWQAKRPRSFPKGRWSMNAIVAAPVAPTPPPSPPQTQQQKIALLQKTVSASRLSCWLGCRLKFFFRATGCVITSRYDAA